MFVDLSLKLSLALQRDQDNTSHISYSPNGNEFLRSMQSSRTLTHDVI